MLLFNDQNTPMNDNTASTTESTNDNPIVNPEYQRVALVVDDDPGMVFLCSTLLARAGYSVASAQNGREAMKKIESQKPDVVFLDLMMPIMNGFEVCERVKNDPETRDIVIAVISALDSKIDQDYARSLGANLYFPKPIFTKKFQTEILPQVEEALNQQPA